MRARFGGGTEVAERPTLADIGVDKKLSSHAQKVAAIPAAEFEGIVGQWRDTLETENERVTTNIITAAEKAAGKPTWAGLRRCLQKGRSPHPLRDMFCESESLGEGGEMSWLFRFRVNTAIVKLGGDPTHVSQEFRQLMQIAGQQSGNSPQEVALWIMSQMPLSYRVCLNLSPVKGWVRNRKINPNDQEVRHALRNLGWDDGTVLM